MLAQGRAIKPNDLGGIPLDMKLLPEYLNDLGYSSYAFGKWEYMYITAFVTKIHQFSHFLLPDGTSAIAT